MENEQQQHNIYELVSGLLQSQKGIITTLPSKVYCTFHLHQTKTLAVDSNWMKVDAKNAWLLSII